jgi:hypothetical protein
LCNDRLHQIGPDAFPRALLHIVQLPPYIAWRTAGQTNTMYFKLSTRAPR